MVETSPLGLQTRSGHFSPDLQPLTRVGAAREGKPAKAYTPHMNQAFWATRKVRTAPRGREGRVPLRVARWNAKALAMAAMVMAGAVVLVGCSESRPEPAPEPSKSTSVQSQPDADVAVTCAVISVVLTTRHNVDSGTATGSLTADESRAILDTIPSTLRVALAAPGAKLNGQVSVLLSSATMTADVNRPAPEAGKALSEIAAACNKNKTPIAVMGEGG